MAGMGCYVIHLDYTILPLTDVIHKYLYVVQTIFFLQLDHSSSQPFIYLSRGLSWSPGTYGGGGIVPGCGASLTLGTEDTHEREERRYTDDTTRVARI